jgi:predicted Rossmann-fold nucleotide-binding protein
MIRILVSGSIDLQDESAVDFAESLGREIINQGHVLLNGCLSELDRIVAESAFNQALDNGLETSKHVVSYILSGTNPSHGFGTILRSHLRSWELTDARLSAPEQIKLADLVVLVGGAEGTWRAANWAKFTNTPILPVTAFGGTAERIYAELIRNFDKNYATLIEKSHYERLNLYTADYEKLAVEVVSIAERIVSSEHVFVIMSFSNDPELGPRLEDAYDSFQEVCGDLEFECSRIDDSSAVDRILPEIFSHIAKSAFVIADLSEEKANVYYELGYAQGLNMATVVTAVKGTELPFDVKDIPVIFWENQKQLKARLREKIGEIAKLHGR